MTKLNIIKLTSGEELMGRVATSADENQIVLEQIFQLVIIPEEDGTQQIGLIPFHIHSNLHKRFKISKQFVQWEYLPSTQLADYYTRITSPIIQTKPSGLIGV